MERRAFWEEGSVLERGSSKEGQCSWCIEAKGGEMMLEEEARAKSEVIGCSGHFSLSFLLVFILATQL